MTTLIIGAGITGMTLALMLDQNQKIKNQSITLVDARPSLSEDEWQTHLNQRDARVYALSLASIDMLKKVGVWDIIRSTHRHADYTQMQVWQQDGKGELLFGEEANGQGATGLLGSMVEPVVIEWALSQLIEQNEHIQTVMGKAVTGLDWLGEQMGYQVTLTDAEQLQGKLLIGADGRGSKVRSLAGIGTDTLDYHQTAICCAIKTEKPHHATARQLMLPTGTLALLPLADKDNPTNQHWQSVVWTLPTNQALDLLAHSDDDLKQALACASQYALGDITQIESIASFPLNAQQAQTYVKPNLALVGDAGHGVHPLAGQGLNLGLQDVQTLVHELMADYNRSSGQAWGDTSTLQRYERLRRPQNSVMMHSFSALNWLFASDFANLRAVQQIRSEGMYQVGKIKPLMRFFTRQASGM